MAVGDVDPNRAWNPPSYREPGDTSTIAEAALVGEAMRTDTSGDVDYLIDFHSTVNHSIPYHYGYILPAWQNDPFWLAVRSREPGLITAGASLIDYTVAKFGRDELNAEFSATFETLFIANENTDRFLSLGENFGRAWNDVLTVASDLNFDGALDVQDYVVLSTYAETNLSALTPIERFAHGDLNGDGMNDIFDFALFKQDYIAAHGAAGFAAMLQNVPEPTFGISLAWGLSWATAPAWRIRRTNTVPSLTRLEG